MAVLCWLVVPISSELGVTAEALPYRGRVVAFCSGCIFSIAYLPIFLNQYRRYIIHQVLERKSRKLDFIQNTTVLRC